MSKSRRFVAKLTPVGLSLDELLGRNLHVDVWERRPDCLLVAAEDGDLAEIARSGIASVEKRCSVEEFVSSKSVD